MFKWFLKNEKLNLQIKLSGEGQNVERRNVERPVFRNFQVANIKIKKDELCDNFIFELYIYLKKNYLNT